MRFEVRLFALVFFGGLFGCSPNTEAPAYDASSDTAPEAAPAQAGAAETETPPNILFIVADDIGFTDLGNVDGYMPADRGFDRSWMQLGGSSSYFAEYLTGDVLGFEDDGRTVELAELPDDFYVTEHYTDKMLGYLQSTEEGTPWFAYMPYTAPHWPLMLPDDWLDRYAGRYDDGYDALRARRFEQASEAGVLPPGSNLDDYQSRAEP